MIHQCCICSRHSIVVWTLERDFTHFSLDPQAKPNRDGVTKVFILLPIEKEKIIKRCGIHWPHRLLERKTWKLGTKVRSV